MVSQKRLIPRGSFSCELSRCLVKWLLNCLCLYLLSPTTQKAALEVGREVIPTIPLPNLSERLWSWTDLCLKRALKLWRERYHRSANACNSLPAEWNRNWIALNWNFGACGWCLVFAQWFSKNAFFCVVCYLFSQFFPQVNSQSRLTHLLKQGLSLEEANCKSLISAWRRFITPFPDIL